MVYNKACCIRCEKEISMNSWPRHVKACKGKLVKVPRTSWNKGKFKDTDIRVMAQAKKAKGRHFLSSLSEEEELNRRQKISATARINKKSGGYRENAGISKKFFVVDSYGKKTCLQSSYELECSIILDRLSIKWSRPTHMKYGGKRYYPDFLLNDFGIYLDTKNDYLAKIDANKIRMVQEENSVKLFVLTKDKITDEFIKELIA